MLRHPSQGDIRKFPFFVTAAHIRMATGKPEFGDRRRWNEPINIEDLAMLVKRHRMKRNLYVRGQRRDVNTERWGSFDGIPDAKERDALLDQCGEPTHGKRTT